MYVVGTVAEIGDLASVYQDLNVLFEVELADLEADPDFFATLENNQAFRVTDTAANLGSNNAQLSLATALEATTSATAEEGAAILATAVGVTTYSLEDTAENLAADGDTMNGAVNIVANTAATTTEATAIVDATNSGENTFDIEDTAANAQTNIADSADWNGAGTITISGTIDDTADADIILQLAGPSLITLTSVSGTTAEVAVTIDLQDATRIVGSYALDAGETITVEQHAAITAVATLAAYDLLDTAENLAAASSVVSGATTVDISDAGTIEEIEAIVAAAGDALDVTTVAIEDTAQAVLDADLATLGLDADESIVITDTAVTAGQATAIVALDAANDADDVDAGTYDLVLVQGAKNVGEFTIDDEIASLLDADNATVVGNADLVTTTEETIDVSNAADLEALNTDAVYSISDSYTNVVVGRATAATAASVNITSNITIAQATFVVNSINAASTYSIVDTAAKIATAVEDDVAALGDEVLTLTATGLASVAQAQFLSTVALETGYAISDTSANISAAFNTVNDGGADDRDVVLGATAITIEDDSTVDEAAGAITGDGTRGLYTISGQEYTIEDTVDNILTALDGLDSAAIIGAADLKLSASQDATVEEYNTLAALSNFSGIEGSGGYIIVDGFDNIQVADAGILSGANSVTANGTGSADNLNMIMIDTGLTIDAGAEDDAITGSAGQDSITGGAGDDTFVLFSADTGLTSGTADTIEDFDTGADSLDAATAGDAMITLPKLSSLDGDADPARTL